MNWLVKEEPLNYSYSQFLTDRTTVWAGVRNPVAQRNLREMKKGDRVFFYHTGKEKAVIGTATVSKTAYPDPKDAGLVVVELTAGKALKRPVTLAEIKADVEKTLADEIAKRRKTQSAAATPPDYRAEGRAMGEIKTDALVVVAFVQDGSKNVLQAARVNVK